MIKQLRQSAQSFIAIPLLAGMIMGLSFYLYKSDLNLACKFGALSVLATWALLRAFHSIAGDIKLIKMFFSKYESWMGALLGLSLWICYCLHYHKMELPFLLKSGLVSVTIGALVGYSGSITISLGSRIGPIIGGIVACVTLVSLNITSKDDKLYLYILFISVLAAGVSVGGLAEFVLRLWLNPSYLREIRLDKHQCFALALGGLVTQVNRDNFYKLRSNYSPEVCRKVLLRDWSIHSETEANKTFTWLISRGHNSIYQETLASLNKISHTNHNREPNQLNPTEQKSDGWIRQPLHQGLPDNIIAWDICRLVQTARWCYSAGFLSEKSAWEWLYRAAHKAQQTYTSWESYADHFLWGYEYWSAGEKDLQFIKAAHWLKTHSESPWQELRWELSPP